MGNPTYRKRPSFPLELEVITHFLAGCASEKVTPTLDLFRYHFQVKRSPKEFGWVTVSSRSDRVFKVKNPDTARKWKPDFIFFRVNDSVSTLSEEWYFGDISDSWNEKNPIPEGEAKLAKLGLRRGGITEEDFLSYGLTPADATKGTVMLRCGSTSTRTFLVRCAKADEANLLKASALLFNARGTLSTKNSLNELESFRTRSRYFWRMTSFAQ